MAALDSILDVPAHRREALRAAAARLRAGRRVVLLTHVNADGDGCGSEAAIARIVAQLGGESWILNPTPWPELYEFLLQPPLRDRSGNGPAALADADLIVILDISDTRRLGPLGGAVRAHRAPKLVIDHHVPGEDHVPATIVADTTACATGELVFDLATTLEATIDAGIATALYAAILTDTGGFRFSNTSPRAHAIAARLLQLGVEPEEMYRRIYASAPAGRIRLLAEALATLDLDPDYGIAWLSVPQGAVERHGIGAEDFDGIVEHPRSIAGVRLALLFREVAPGRTKVSFRSTGDVDSQKLASEFGGGGHVKASGALVAGSLAEVQHRVVEAARRTLGPVKRSSR